MYLFLSAGTAHHSVQQDIGSPRLIPRFSIPRCLEMLLNPVSALINQNTHSMFLVQFLLNHQGKKLKHRMPELDHGKMPLANRVTVPAGLPEIVLRHDLIRDGIAERAGHRMLYRENPRTSNEIITNSHVLPLQASPLVSCRNSEERQTKKKSESKPRCDPRINTDKSTEYISFHTIPNDVAERQKTDPEKPDICPDHNGSLFHYRGKNPLER